MTDTFRFSPRPNRAAEIRWREWGEESFREAAEQGKLVLLSISAVWCHWCHVMDETTYSDPEVIELVNAGFIPVRVDNDRRPDINRRYNQGGWPTTAFLSPQGDLLAGTTYLPPESMRAVLKRFRELWEEKGREIEGQIRESEDNRGREGPAGEKRHPAMRLHQGIRDEVWRALARAQDHRHGGLGGAPKFLMPDTLELALDVYQDRRNPSALAWLTLTLDNMLSGGVYDRLEGGFFRYSTTPDWSVPHYEKMLSDNARMAVLLLRAWRITRKPSYREKAVQTLDYVGRTLGDGKGWFYGSQDADEEYYAEDMAGRGAHGAPFVDPTVYINSQAEAVTAFLEAGELLNNHRFREWGRSGLELLAGLVSGKSGVPHFKEGRDFEHRGLLEDQALALLAIQYGHQLTGEPDLLEKSIALGKLLAERYWDEERHILRDIDPRFHDVRLRPQPAEISDAAAAARGLCLLSRLAMMPDLEEAARGILESYADTYPLYSYHAAAYARAVDLLLTGPTVVSLRGRSGEGLYQGLRRAVVLSPLPRLVLDPTGNNVYPDGGADESDPDRPPIATVCRGSSCSMATRDPEELARALAVNSGLWMEG